MYQAAKASLLLSNKQGISQVFLELVGIFGPISFVFLQTTPKLEGPKYVVWKKTKDYEIRRYSRYLAAEVSMPSNSKPASGEGFQELAGYIFGGNQG